LGKKGSAKIGKKGSQREKERREAKEKSSPGRETKPKVLRYD